MGDNATTIVLGVISLLQSVTQAAVVTLSCLVFLFVERRAAELVDGLPPSSCDDDTSTATTASTVVVIISGLEMPPLQSKRRNEGHQPPP
ncbi:membrane-associated protein, putative [Bodo saltans]|uniref:Membrane-associated protein, putative n=1 Tax=Bodo saltans TaxID=75058 RepID=A0A0S4J3Z5_BODSA|nr:membrane-associated protein, putative [Bodo saltans]|eukprot:CUG64076.1 membrane-associated protein, putative [Bodo saltans]